MSGKVPAVDEKQTSEKTMKVSKFADVLVFK